MYCTTPLFLNSLRPATKVCNILILVTEVLKIQVQICGSGELYCLEGFLQALTQARAGQGMSSACITRH